MTTDLLFQIFQQHLTNPDCKIGSAKDFIQKVVRTYLIFLSGMGNIPQGHIEDIVEDLEAEVLEMYRKKTYGFYDLKEYRKSLKNTTQTSQAANKFEAEADAESASAKKETSIAAENKT